MRTLEGTCWVLRAMCSRCTPKFRRPLSWRSSGAYLAGALRKSVSHSQSDSVGPAPALLALRKSVSHTSSSAEPARSPESISANRNLRAERQATAHSKATKRSQRCSVCEVARSFTFASEYVKMLRRVEEVIAIALRQGDETITVAGHCNPKTLLSYPSSRLQTPHFVIEMT